MAAAAAVDWYTFALTSWRMQIMRGRNVTEKLYLHWVPSQTLQRRTPVGVRVPHQSVRHPQMPPWRPCLWYVVNDCALNGKKTTDQPQKE